MSLQTVPTVQISQCLASFPLFLLLEECLTYVLYIMSEFIKVSKYILRLEENYADGLDKLPDLRTR